MNFDSGTAYLEDKSKLHACSFCLPVTTRFAFPTCIANFAFFTTPNCSSAFISSSVAELPSRALGHLCDRKDPQLVENEYTHNSGTVLIPEKFAEEITVHTRLVQFRIITAATPTETAR